MLTGFLFQWLSVVVDLLAIILQSFEIYAEIVRFALVSIPWVKI